MKTRIISVILFMVFYMVCNAQQNPSWENWSWLIGEWKGEGSGQPGQGGGVFSFSYNLDKRIIERKSHSEYPATQDKPLVIHDDLMIIYPDGSGKPLKAIYFDNENHVINYTISFSGKSIVFLSDKIQNMPVFRLTYTPVGNDVVNTKFEMSQDGEKFMVYIEGNSKKIK